jgi:hypothetical protein
MLKALIVGLVVVGTGALARATWPDVARYLRMRQM